MSQGPKIYDNKPPKKKAHLKRFQDQQIFASTTPPSSTMASTPPPPPPQLPRESFARRYKFVWPMLLTVNLGVGVYLFMRTKKKEIDVVEEEVAPAVTTVAQTTPTIEKPLPQPTITEPLKLREPISEDQQREALKWILEEKRKINPNDPEEKKHIDEEKALLKQFIRAKSLPRI